MDYRSVMDDRHQGIVNYEKGVNKNWGIAFSAQRVYQISGRMGLDPAELHIKNSIHPGEPHPAKFIINACGFSEGCVSEA